MQPDICSELRLLPTPPAFDDPVSGGFPSEYCHDVWDGKTIMMWLPDGEKRLKTRCVCVSVCVCLSVCVSVTFVHFVKTNKQIFELFTSLPYQTGWRYSDTNPPNAGVECRWGRLKIAILSLYLASLPAVNAATDRCCQYGRRWTAATVPQAVTHRC